MSRLISPLELKKESTDNRECVDSAKHVWSDSCKQCRVVNVMHLYMIWGGGCCCSSNPYTLWAGIETQQIEIISIPILPSGRVDRLGVQWRSCKSAEVLRKCRVFFCINYTLTRSFCLNNEQTTTVPTYPKKVAPTNRWKAVQSVGRRGKQCSIWDRKTKIAPSCGKKVAVISGGELELPPTTQRKLTRSIVVYMFAVQKAMSFGGVGSVGGALIRVL